MRAAKARQAPDPAATSPAERAKPAVRKRLSGPAMRTFFSIAQKWGLDNKEQIALLGSPAPSTFYKYKAGDVGTLSFDLLTRLSLVLGIYKALRILFPDTAVSDRWFTLPNSNPMFGGLTPAAYVAQGDIDALYRVRRLLDARRGGWH
jgi:hypothetical protein